MFGIDITVIVLSKNLIWICFLHHWYTLINRLLYSKGTQTMAHANGKWINGNNRPFHNLQEIYPNQLNVDKHWFLTFRKLETQADICMKSSILNRENDWLPYMLSLM